MNAKLMGWIVLPLIGLVLAGMFAIWLLKALMGIAFYLVAGALVVGGGAYLYRRLKRGIAPGTRARRRIEAATAILRDRH